jgi:hypothetical protein
VPTGQVSTPSSAFSGHRWTAPVTVSTAPTNEGGDAAERPQRKRPDEGGDAYEEQERSTTSRAFRSIPPMFSFMMFNSYVRYLVYCIFFTISTSENRSLVRIHFHPATGSFWSSGHPRLSMTAFGNWDAGGRHG